MPEEKYIQINDEYYLATDRYNFIIAKKLNCTSKDGKPIMRNEAYCSSLEHLFKWMTEHLILDNPDLLKDNVEVVVKKIKELQNDVMKAATKEIRRLNKSSDSSSEEE